MQSVISEVATDFIDDALGLATGVRCLTVDLIREALTSVHAAITAPVDRLASACDVAGIIPGRQAAKPRLASGRGSPNRTRAPRRRPLRFDPLGVRATFRTLRDLT
jgi:hypothetical protein